MAGQGQQQQQSVRDQTEASAGFPTAGLDVTCEFGRQPADTTPQAVNVRTFEVITERGRGGSRPGLSRWVNQTVQGDNPVQHLNILVDPQNPALRAEVENLPGTILDPSTNNRRNRNFGRYVRGGGSGRQPAYGAPEPEDNDEPVDEIYRMTVNSITLFDGDFVMDVTYNATGNGARNGMTLGIEAAITPDPFGITASVPPNFQGWICSASAYDQVFNEIVTVGAHIRVHEVVNDAGVPNYNVDLIELE